MRYRTITQEREHELEQLGLAINPINNIVTTNIIEQPKLIGQEREINKIQKVNIYSHNSYKKFLPYTKPIDFSVGEKYGSLGNTGIAKCFNAVPDNKYDANKTTC